MTLVSRITDLAVAIGLAVKASRDRANHTGTQSASTIADFNSAVQIAVTGASIESVDLILPINTTNHEYRLTRANTLPSSNVRVWLGPTSDIDDNEISTLEGINIDAICETGAIAFYFRSRYPESGIIKLNYQVF